MKIISAIIIALFGFLPIPQQANAQNALTKFLRKPACSSNMSCIDNTISFSPIPDLDVFKYNNCTTDYWSHSAVQTIDLCEPLAFDTSYAPRQRAIIMTVLGYAYMHKDVNDIEFSAAGIKRTFSVWKQAGQVDPSYVDADLAASYIYREFHMPKEALAELDSVEMRQPNNWRVHTYRALTLNGIHQSYAAFSAIRTAVTLNPNEPEVNYVYGRVLFSLNQLNLAAEQMKLAAVSFNPMDRSRYEMMKLESPWSILSQIYVVMNQPQKAADALTEETKVPNIIIDLFSFMERRSGLYEKAGQFEKAAADLDTAAKNAPEKYAKDLVVRRDILLAKSNTDGTAIENLRTVLARGALKPILQVQVFLKNQGYKEIDINGIYDEKTKAGLAACALDIKCTQIIGQKT